MSLSCSCDFDWDPDPGDWTYQFIDGDLDFKTFKRFIAKRCCSCDELISYGSVCIKFTRYRYPYDEIEARITGDTYFELNDEPTIRIADHFHCERCGEIYLNLIELGFECLTPCEHMPSSFTDYKELYLNKESAQ